MVGAWLCAVQNSSERCRGGRVQTVRKASETVVRQWETQEGKLFDPATGCRWSVLQSSEMEAVAWTAIGLLGAAVLGSFGSFFYLGTRIDALGARLDSRIDAQSERIDAQSDRIDAQGARIDAQGARIDVQYASIQAQGRDLMSAIQAQGRDLVGAIQAQGLELGARIDALAARMDDHLGRHAG
jgi:hypothetical protein